jgi:hypothetical protein
VAAPATLDRGPGQGALLFVAELVENVGHRRPGVVEEQCRVGAGDELEKRPPHGVRHRDAPDFGCDAHPPPFRAPDRRHRRTDVVRHADGVLVGQEHRRHAVGGGKRLGDRALGKADNFGEHRSGGDAVELAARTRIKEGSERQHFEQVELDVAQVGFVMSHLTSSGLRRLIGPFVSSGGRATVSTTRLSVN